ncbi:hypothetical protein [Streptomyces exfoliatus]|uniref:hypothetical protein n=1 Tax=Streptomyces exfoliatus TaxID=1905 RepID=UPI0012FEFA51|nr:hypothetical protein [Streptomyces exfoliatus]
MVEQDRALPLAAGDVRVRRGGGALGGEGGAEPLDPGVAGVRGDRAVLEEPGAQGEAAGGVHGVEDLVPGVLPFQLGEDVGEEAAQPAPLVGGAHFVEHRVHGVPGVLPRPEAREEEADEVAGDRAVDRGAEPIGGEVQVGARVEDPGSRLVRPLRLAAHRLGEPREGPALLDEQAGRRVPSAGAAVRPSVEQQEHDVLADPSVGGARRSRGGPDHGGPDPHRHRFLTELLHVPLPRHSRRLGEQAGVHAEARLAHRDGEGEAGAGRGDVRDVDPGQRHEREQDVAGLERGDAGGDGAARFEGVEGAQGGGRAGHDPRGFGACRGAGAAARPRPGDGPDDELLAQFLRQGRGVDPDEPDLQRELDAGLCLVQHREGQGMAEDSADVGEEPIGGHPRADRADHGPRPGGGLAPHGDPGRAAFGVVRGDRVPAVPGPSGVEGLSGRGSGGPGSVPGEHAFGSGEAGRDGRGELPAQGVQRLRSGFTDEGDPDRHADVDLPGLTHGRRRPPVTR